MRIETNKNSQVNKQDTANTKTEKPVFGSSQIPISTDRIVAQASPGAFAKILDEARKDTKVENKPGTADSRETDEANKSADDETKTSKNEKADENLEIDEREGNSDEQSGDAESDENASQSTQVAIKTDNKSATEINAPAARSILHVADLERIVSSVRTESNGTEKKVLISLKHSVLEGLQVRLAIDESGNIKAQFLAQSEEIKKQLKKRERELLDILKQRSPRFSTIDVLLS